MVYARKTLTDRASPPAQITATALSFFLIFLTAHESPTLGVVIKDLRSSGRIFSDFSKNPRKPKLPDA